MKQTTKSGGVKEGSRKLPLAALASLAVFPLYLAALVCARGRVPAGLNNDAAEEALRGLYLVEGRHFEVITVAIGNSAETLYLYLVGAMVQLFGPTTLSIQLLSWLFALACIWMVWKLVERIDDRVPPWVPLLTGACSIWLFHYARSGLRAISAPFFLCAFALLLDRAERRPDNRNAALACGAVLGLSIYAYTSARALPVAFAIYAVIRLLRGPESKAVLLRRYVMVGIGALAVSIPNLVFLGVYPKEFLLRGSYVLKGGAGDRVVNLIWSFLFPLYYPPGYNGIDGPAFHSDGVSAGLTSSGFHPFHILFAAAMLWGLWQSRRFFSGAASKPLAIFLLSAWIAATLLLGIAGPSLTRFLILLPVYLVFAALGFFTVWQARPQMKIPVLLLILFVGLSDGYRYLSGGGAAPGYYGAAATAIGETSEKLASGGQKVISIVSRDSDVVSYLTNDQRARVSIVEFYQCPLDPSSIPFNFAPDALLIEDSPVFRPYTLGLPAAWRAGRGDHFYYFRPVR